MASCVEEGVAMLLLARTAFAVRMKFPLKCVLPYLDVAFAGAEDDTFNDRFGEAVEDMPGATSFLKFIQRGVTPVC